MNDSEENKSTGGIAPFGYRWQHGRLIVDEAEAPTRKLIYELFIKHRRKKTVARLLNDLGCRTRSGALFSDTTIDRLIRDTTAKGIKIVEGKECAVEPIVSKELWERANNLLGIKQTKPAVQLFAGLAFCDCGGIMIVLSNSEKYVCLDCRHKIGAQDLEEIFSSQLAGFPISIGNSTDANLSDYWLDLSPREKRLVIEQICAKIIVGKADIAIEYAFNPNTLKTAAFGQQNAQGNETPKVGVVHPNQEQSPPVPSEPLMNEIAAAKFLGISRMTLLRKRNAQEIGFYRVGFRVLYSKEKHLLPFLEGCEK